MAVKPKPMSQIKQILRFTQQGKSITFIARNLIGQAIDVRSMGEIVQIGVKTSNSIHCMIV